MQTVSTSLLAALRANRKTLVTVVELYNPDSVPGVDGFDPASSDFVIGFAAVEGITFRGRTYKKLLNKGGVGRITRTINKQLSGFTLSLSNSTREIIDFELDTNFEGLICVVRRLDRETSVNLDDSLVRFTGRCEPPEEFTKSSETARVPVKQIMNATEINIPRRKFSISDPQGRMQSDPEFEGFVYQQRGGAINYNERVLRGGLMGALFQRKKTVTRTLNYSSHSDLQEETDVPVIFGRVQTQLITFTYIDRGTWIEFSGFWCDGHDTAIEGIQNFRSVTDGMGLGTFAHRYGKIGGTVEDSTHQTNDDPGWFAAGYYSRTAYTRAVGLGSKLNEDDAAPTCVAMVYGQKLPIPDPATGAFTSVKFSDSAVAQSRFVLSSSYYFNLPDEWHDDAENLIAYDYGNHVLVDNHNTDTVLLPVSQMPHAGVKYSIYKSTSRLSPSYYKNEIGIDVGLDPYAQETEYNFYSLVPISSDDPGTGTIVLAPTVFRRRFTSNINLREQMKAIDFLFDVLLPGSNLYLVQKANGKIAHRHKKPEDYSFVRTATAASATTIPVQNINPWLTKQGKILIGATLTTAEVREIVSVNYSTAGNSIGITASGGMSASAATLSGAGGATPASATLTVTAATGTKTYTIDGFNFSYTPATGDTIETVAAFVAAQVNSNEIVNKRIKAVWNLDATVTVQSRLGDIVVDSPLEFAHYAAIADPASAISLTETTGGALEAGKYQYSRTYVTAEGETNPSPVTEITIAANKKISVPAVTMPARVIAVRHYFSTEKNGVRRRLHTENTGAQFYINDLPRTFNRMEPVTNTTGEEIHRVAFAFTDKGAAQTSLTRSNVLKGTFTFKPGTSDLKNYNQVKIKYQDSAADYRQTTLIVNDYAKQAKAKKVITLEINGAGIDNHHQAQRIANSRLAEISDGNRFYGFSSDNEAQLLEEGDVVVVTDESGRLVNESGRIETIEDDDSGGYPAVSFSARKYRRYYYDDQTQERLVPLAIVQNDAINREQQAPIIYLATAATNTLLDLGVRNFSTVPYYREIQVAHTSTFLVPSDITSFVQNANNQVGQILPEITGITRTDITNHTALTGTETVYVRVRHSSNGNLYGEWSNVLPATYANSGGTGGSGGDTPPEPGGGDGGSGGAAPSGFTVTITSSTLDPGTPGDPSDPATYTKDYTFAWTNNGGTGSNIIEVKIGTASWITHKTVSSATATTTSALNFESNKTVKFRVRNANVIGYSNEVTG